MPPMNRHLLQLALGLWSATVFAQVVPADGILLDSYAAVVNGKVITIGEVLSALQPVQDRLAAQYTGTELEQKLVEEYDTVRNALIESEIILLDFEMQGGALPDRAVEDNINSIIHDRFQNDRTAFLKALAAERITFAEWRKQMKDQLTVQIMRQKEVTSKIFITPYDLQTAYAQKREAFAVPERVRLRTLALDGGDTAQEKKNALADAAKLRERILSGETTFESAATNSVTPQDADEFIDTASLNEALRTAIASLDSGSISAPLEIGDDLYLVQLVERQAARVRPLDEVSPELAKELRKSQFERLNRIWIDSLRSKYYVQLFAHNLFD